LRAACAILLAAVLLAGCRSVEAPPDRGDGPVGTIRAIPFGVFAQQETPRGEPFFFNARLGVYQVIRPIDDSAEILFFETQADADFYVRSRFVSERRLEVPLIEVWPALQPGIDYDQFVARDFSAGLREELDVILNRALRDPDWGDTGHPVFESELSGRMTDYFVSVRDGSVGATRRLEVRSANLLFRSVRQVGGLGE